jgi:hypothetical protein
MLLQYPPLTAFNGQAQPLRMPLSDALGAVLSGLAGAGNRSGTYLILLATIDSLVIYCCNRWTLHIRILIRALTVAL